MFISGGNLRLTSVSETVSLSKYNFVSLEPYVDSEFGDKLCHKLLAVNTNYSTAIHHVIPACFIFSTEMHLVCVCVYQDTSCEPE